MCVCVCVCVCRNLQAAIGAFYDHYSVEGGVLPDIALVARIMEHGTASGDQLVTLSSNTTCTQTWTLRNTGQSWSRLACGDHSVFIVCVCVCR